MRSLAIAAGVVTLLAATAGPSRAGRPAPSPRPVYIPWTAAVEDDGVESVFGHHAGLGFLQGLDAAFAFSLPVGGQDDRPSQFTWAAAGNLGPIAMALGYSLFPDEAGIDAMVHRVDWGMAIRFSRELSIGLGWQGLYSDASTALDDYDHWSLSMTLRPLRALAFAVGFDRIDTPRLGDQVMPANARLSIGIRPATERVTIALEGNREIRDDGGWGVGGSFRTMPVDGFQIGAYARYARSGGIEDAERVEWGAFLALSQGAFELQTAFDGATGVGDTSGSEYTFGTMIKAGTVRRTSIVPRSDLVVRITIPGHIPERPSTGLLDPGGTPFAYWLAALEVVARDPAVVGLVLDVAGAPSWGQIWELRQAIDRVKAAGKKVFATVAVPDMRAMYLAAAADKILMHPAGTMMTSGLAITRSYYGELLADVGVQAQIVRYEQYKTAPEGYTRTGPSDESNEQTRDILAAFDRTWIEAVGKGRQKTEAELRKVLAEGPLDMKMAVDMGMVDELVYDDAVGEVVKRELGEGATIVRHYRPNPRAWERWSGVRRVAIVPVVGTIVDGKTTMTLPIDLPFIGGETTGDGTVVPAIRRAAADGDIVGIVIRVDSGGGAVMASDRMHRAVMEAARKKPVIVSFGNVAASGGYYLAAGAPRILAAPVTITGSIGIFTGKVDISGLYKKLGIATHTEKTAPSADAMGEHRPWTPEELARARERLKTYYDRFVQIVADGRKLNKEAAYERAKGRVFDGSRALELQLVDAHGGLWDAIEWIKQQAGVSGEPIGIRYIPEATDALTEIINLLAGAIGLLADDGTLAAGKALADNPLAKLAVQLMDLRAGEARAQLPYFLEIR